MKEDCYILAKFAYLTKFGLWGSGNFVKNIVQEIIKQVNLDMTDSIGPGKLVRHMQNPLYTYDEYLICIRLGPSLSSVICKNLLYSGPSYPSSPV